jgi:nitrate/TMAO reductase-like tetraheme cytochrome c subunit
MATTPPRSGVAAAAGWRLAALLWLASCAAFGWTDPAGAGFDHASTGYPLTGVHAAQPCESCHIGGRMKGTPRTCDSCHTAGPALAKANVVMPQKHVPAVVGCAECHNTQSFARTKFRHNMVNTVSCQTCHTGLAATGKTPRHVAAPAGQPCGDCHRSTSSWLPASFNHTQVTVANNCFSCHDGSHDGATGRPVTHVPGLFVVGEGINNCDSCHLDGFGFRSWVPARVHQFLNVKSQCASCHTGAFPPAAAQPRTPSHVGASPLCETCHRSTRSWLELDLSGASNSVSKTRVAAATTAKTRLLAATVPPPRHIPLAGSAPCTSCHRSARDMATSVVMNHGVVSTLDCKTCHNGSYVAQGAQAAAAQHIPYKTMLLNGTGMDCDDCHKGFTGANWAAVKMNHNGTPGGGAGSCKGCHQQGTAFQGQMEKRALAHAGKGPSASDCSSSGCHGPLGRTGARFARWK